MVEVKYRYYCKSMQCWLFLGLRVEELAVAVLQKLLIRSGDGATQADLVDLCGVDCTEIIANIIANRDHLLKSYEVKDAFSALVY